MCIAFFDMNKIILSINDFVLSVILFFHIDINNIIIDINIIVSIITLMSPSLTSNLKTKIFCNNNNVIGIIQYMEANLFLFLTKYQNITKIIGNIP